MMMRYKAAAAVLLCNDMARPADAVDAPCTSGVYSFALNRDCGDATAVYYSSDSLSE